MKCVVDKVHGTSLENDKSNAFLEKAGKGRAEDFWNK